MEVEVRWPGGGGGVRKKPEATKTLFLRPKKLIGGEGDSKTKHTRCWRKRNADLGLELLLIGSFGKAICAWTGCGG